MNPTIKEDFNFSSPEFLKPTSEEDMKQGIDGWICGVPFAYRKRRKSYDDITIRYRRKNGAETEYIKIIDGRFRSLIFFFDFPDKIIICSTTSIKHALENHDFKIITNTDGTTELAVIPLTILKPLVWKKD
ncbi:MAG: hypothetical protein NTV82_15575 [Candidatus Aminicenantes bacterium]|nr:hypothetical protein [Candidatus Aminicenantes bacterium]